jgi:hypothetical protein
MLQRAAHTIRISKERLIACLQGSDMFHLVSRKTPGQTFFFILSTDPGET